MKTAIIDDNSREAEHLRQLLADYAADNKIDITISYFDCGEAFLDSSVRSKFDVIFLDIFMNLQFFAQVLNAPLLIAVMFFPANLTLFSFWQL